MRARRSNRNADTTETRNPTKTRRRLDKVFPRLRVFASSSCFRGVEKSGEEVRGRMRKWHGVRGQATVEYVLIVAVILAALIAAIGGTQGGSIATSIQTMFTRLGDWLKDAVDNHATLRTN